MKKTTNRSKPTAKKTAPAKPDANVRARSTAVAEIECRIAELDGKPAKKAAKKSEEPKPKRVSALDAAAQVLAGSKEPMRAKELITAMAAKGLWTSPGGKTPEATLYAAMLREITLKGKDARFKKHDRGTFVAAKAA